MSIGDTGCFGHVRQSVVGAVGQKDRDQVAFQFGAACLPPAWVKQSR